jgi:large subunit ribosomal protein L4
MKVKVYDQHGKSHGETDLKIQPTGTSSQLIQDAVVSYRANQRQGNACTKTRGEVAGAGKKPWRQKGTGRARSGSIRSPIWRHGGTVFGPKPRDYSKRMPKGMKRAAFCDALVRRAEDGDLIVVKELKVSGPKTREFAEIVDKLPLDGARALFVYAKIDNNTRLAGRNIEQIDLTDADSLNVYQVLRFNKLVFTADALEKVRGRLYGEAKAAGKEKGKAE